MCYVKSRLQRCVSVFPVMCVFVLKAGAYYCYVAGVLTQTPASPGHVAVHSLVTLFWTLAVVAYVQCIWTNPGNGGDTFVERLKDEDKLAYQPQFDPEDFGRGKVTLCTKCNKYVQRGLTTARCAATACTASTTTVC